MILNLNNIKINRILRNNEWYSMSTVILLKNSSSVNLKNKILLENEYDVKGQTFLIGKFDDVLTNCSEWKMIINI